MQPQPVRHRFESHRSRAIRPPGRYGRVRAVRDSPSNAATCHRVVPTGAHSAESPGDRRDRHKREPRLGPRRPASPKGSIKSKTQGRLQARGVPGVARFQTALVRGLHESPRFAVARHDFSVLARHDILDIFRWIWVRHNTGWHVTIRVAWLASVGGCVFNPQPLLHTIPSVSRAWVVGLKLAPSPARAYRRSQGAEHA